MRYPQIAGTLLITCLVACGVGATAASGPSEVHQAEMPGSDRDRHGCIPSAGYSWCTRTDQCERPWELGQDQGFEPTLEAFDEYCRNPK